MKKGAMLAPGVWDALSAKIAQKMSFYLILDCEILEGNPADVTLVETLFWSCPVYMEDI